MRGYLLLPPTLSISGYRCTSAPWRWPPCPRPPVCPTSSTKAPVSTWGQARLSQTRWGPLCSQPCSQPKGFILPLPSLLDSEGAVGVLLAALSPESSTEPAPEEALDKMLGTRRLREG